MKKEGTLWHRPVCNRFIFFLPLSLFSQQKKKSMLIFGGAKELSINLSNDAHTEVSVRHTYLLHILAIDLLRWRYTQGTIKRPFACTFSTLAKRAGCPFEVSWSPTLDYCRLTFLLATVAVRLQSETFTNWPLFGCCCWCVCALHLTLSSPTRCEIVKLAIARVVAVAFDDEGKVSVKWSIWRQSI